MASKYDFEEATSLAYEREYSYRSFQRRITLLVFVTLMIVGMFLIGVGSYIAIIELQFDPAIERGFDKYIFIGSGVTVILFAAQLSILRVFRGEDRDIPLN